MTIAIARAAANLANDHACPLCGLDRTTHVLALPGLRIDRLGRRLWIAGQEVRLTRLEFELAAYFAQHPNEVITKQQLYRDVWGYRVMPRSTRTMESHVSRLRRKLDDIDADVFVLRNVWGVGWRLQKPD